MPRLLQHAIDSKAEEVNWRNTSLQVNGPFNDELYVWGSHKGHAPPSAYEATTTGSDVMEDHLHVFFHPYQLVSGEIMPLYFRGPFPSYTPAFLSRKEAAQIPFSLRDYDAILTYLGIKKNTSLAQAVYRSLSYCNEVNDMEFCTTSYEGMKLKMEKLMRSKVKAYNTTKLPTSSPVLQKYTLVSTPAEIKASTRSISCHMLAYPYAVFTCHRIVGTYKGFELKLEGEDGARLSAIAVCHYSTSKFDPEYPAFKYLGSVPGDPLCHILHSVGFLWVPSPTIN